MPSPKVAVTILNGVRVGGFDHPVMRRRREVFHMLGIKEESGEIAFKGAVRETGHLYAKGAEDLKKEAQNYIKDRLEELDLSTSSPILETYNYILSFEGPISKEMYVDVLSVKLAVDEGSKKRVEDALSFKYGHHLDSLAETSRKAFDTGEVRPWCWPAVATPKEDFLFESFYPRDNHPWFRTATDSPPPPTLECLALFDAIFCRECGGISCTD